MLVQLEHITLALDNQTALSVVLARMRMYLASSAAPSVLWAPTVPPSAAHQPPAVRHVLLVHSEAVQASRHVVPVLLEPFHLPGNMFVLLVLLAHTALAVVAWTDACLVLLVHSILMVHRAAVSRVQLVHTPTARASACHNSLAVCVIKALRQRWLVHSVLLVNTHPRPLVEWKVARQFVPRVHTTRSIAHPHVCLVHLAHILDPINRA